jgi:hypothetical protein
VVSTIYELNKDEDGFLYVCCSEENTFGWKGMNEWMNEYFRRKI